MKSILFFFGLCIFSESDFSFLKEPKESDKEFIYLNEKISYEDYKTKKAKELETMKSLYSSLYSDTKLKYNYTKYFNIAHGCSTADYEKLESKMLIFFKDTYPKYFPSEPKYAVRVVLFPNKIKFKKEMGFDSYGVYYPKQEKWTPTAKTFFSYCGSGPGTAWHEMIHAFSDFFANYDNTQDWFTEGFASFYEMGATSGKNFLEGYTNWRLPEVQEVLRKKKLVPLKEFLLDSDMKQDYGYSYARIFFCYLWTKKKMIPFVKKYLFELSKEYKGKELGKKVISYLEETLEMKIDEIQIELESFIKKYSGTNKLKQE